MEITFLLRSRDQNWIKRKLFFFLLSVLLCCLMYWVWGLPSGHFIIDEGVYHLMAHNVNRGSWIHIDNGYEVFPYYPFTLRFLKANGLELASQYPPLFPVISSLFVKFLGVKGLILTSILSHFASIWIVFSVAKSVFKSASQSALVAVIYGFGTFSLVYAFSAFSQSLAMLLILLSVSPLIRDRDLQNSDFVISGLFTGLACLTRIDCLLVVVAIGCWILWVFPFRQAIVYGLRVVFGMVPSVIILAQINYLKFGVLNPLSYGSNTGNVSLSAHLMLFLTLLSVTLFICITKSSWYQYLQVKTKSFIWLGFSLLAMLVMWIIAFDTMEKALRGISGLLVDMRLLAISVPGPAMYFGPEGTVMYAGENKKALLQSLPLLSVGLLLGGVYSIMNRKKDNGHSLLLWLTAALTMLPFLLLGWHGGLSYNQRYFLPAIPSLLLLSFLVFRECFSISRLLVYLMAGAVISVALFVLSSVFPAIPFWGPCELLIPIVLSLMVFFAGCNLIFSSSEVTQKAHCTTVFLVSVSVVWGIMTTLSDLNSAHVRREESVRIGQWTEDLLDSKSILITNYPDPYFGNIKNEVKFANPVLDEFVSMQAILKQADQNHYKIYVSLPKKVLEEMYRLGWINGYSMCGYVSEGGSTLVRLRRGSCI